MVKQKPSKRAFCRLLTLEKLASDIGRSFFLNLSLDVGDPCLGRTSRAPHRRTRHVPQARPHPWRHHCDRRRRSDPDLRFRAYARPSWPWSLARRFRCRHYCADNGHCVGVLRRKESRLYAVRPPRSPHYSLQLTTPDGQQGSPGFGSEVGASLSARLAFSCRAEEFVMLAVDVDAPAQGRLTTTKQGHVRRCYSKASRDPRSRPAVPVSSP